MDDARASSRAHQQECSTDFPLSWFDRLVLCAGLAVAKAPIPPKVEMAEGEIDEDLLDARLEDQYRERVFPLVHAYAMAKGWLWSERTKSRLALIRKSNTVLIAELVALVEKLNDAEVPVVLLKGSDLMLSVYPPDVPRMMDDVDLLIRPPDLPKAVAACADLGYVQGSVDLPNLRIVPAEPSTLAATSTRGYELPPFLKFLPVEVSPEEAAGMVPPADDRFVTLGSDVYFLAECDVHFNVSPQVEVRDLWFDLRRLRLDDRAEVLAQNVSDLLWLLAVRGYERIVKDRPAAIRSFLDILVLLSVRNSEIHWERVVSMSHKYSAEPSLYYLLWHARELLEGVVPDWVIDELYPAADGISRVNDAGDVTPRLFHTVNIQPMLS
jgi:Uncharacterised nucleotidyltransferase